MSFFLRRYGFLLPLILALPLWAQGGPPLLTDDPGTPGNKNWEINTAVTVSEFQREQDVEAPALDINYGWGERIQLKYESSWLYLNANGMAPANGWANSLAGVKWRFIDNKKHELAISTYPQFEWSVLASSVRRGLADPGQSFLLPIEVTKALGPIELNLEGGHWFSTNSPGWISGLAVGHQQTKRLELLGEVHRVTGAYAANQTVFNQPSTQTVFNLGGRFRLMDAALFIFSAGRSFSGPSSGQPQFIGYFGVQWLLPVKAEAADRP